MFKFATVLRAKHRKVDAVGLCHGDWAAFRWGAKEQEPTAAGGLHYIKSSEPFG
jgi:hypothetical protein